MKKTYCTSEVAKIIGVHPNTVRLYEKVGFITKPHYKKNGYREFTELQIDQMELGRVALKSELVQNGLRKKEVQIVKLSAQKKWQEAINETKNYIEMLKQEKFNTQEAIKITKEILSNENPIEEPIEFTRKQAAEYLNLTVDKIRNWELNGLIKINRHKNGYRIYNNDDIRMLKIIRALRCANYSLMSILRLIDNIKQSKAIDFEKILNTPGNSEMVETNINVCDRLLHSLDLAEKYAHTMMSMLINMKEKY